MTTRISKESPFGNANTKAEFTLSADPAGSSSLGFWRHPATVTPNNFVYKSLSNWAFNTAVGCGHACRFCYVPAVATVKQGAQLLPFGVDDPDAQWGDYVLLRAWDEKAFLSSLRKAERTPASDLKPDGNRAVIYCSTTDPYQVFRNPDVAVRKELDKAAEFLIRRSLELIRDRSTLNVRILTRSSLAERDFDLFASFGKRLVFGMSLPTVRNDLAKVYEPKVAAPSRRLQTLHAAKKAGLNVFVAMAPTFPESDEADLRQTLNAIKEVDPITIFHEPINVRAENVARIARHAEEIGFSLNTAVFNSRESWRDYAMHSLKTVERLADDLGLADRLHLWPDQSLGAKWVRDSMPNPDAHMRWINAKWSRISEWPR